MEESKNEINLEELFNDEIIMNKSNIIFLIILLYNLL